MPATEICLPEKYGNARLLCGFVDGLFTALPALIRRDLANDPINLLRELRRRAFRDRLAADGLMLFEADMPAEQANAPQNHANVPQRSGDPRHRRPDASGDG